MYAWMNFSVLPGVMGFVVCDIFTTIVKEIAVNLLVTSFMYVLLLVCGYKGKGNSAARYRLRRAGNRLRRA